MNLYIKALCLTCIFHCAAYSSSAGSQDKDSLSDESGLIESAIQYEKEFFQAESLIDREIALLNKSYCYKTMGHFEHALEILKRGINLGGKDSISYYLRYEAVLNSYLSGNSQSALSEIKLIQYYFPEKSQESLSIILLHALILNDQARWKEAQQILLSNSTVIGVTEEIINSIYSSREKAKLKKVNKAFALSLLLPGSGQIYAGRLDKGLISILLQAGSLTYGIHGLLESYFFTGALPGIAIFNSLYMGGADYAKELVEQKNMEVINDINSSVNTVLFEFFKDH